MRGDEHGKRYQPAATALARHGMAPRLTGTPRLRTRASRLLAGTDVNRFVRAVRPGGAASLQRSPSADHGLGMVADRPPHRRTSRHADPASLAAVDRVVVSCRG